MDRLILPLADLGSAFHALIATSSRTRSFLAATSPPHAAAPANQVSLGLSPLVPAALESIRYGEGPL